MRVRSLLLAVSFGLACPTAVVLLGVPARAACDLTPTLGNSVYVCDSGSSAGLTDADGTNSLTLPAGGTGQINGNVTFGEFVDTVVIDAGVIDGAVNQAGGADNFVMTGGEIQFLNQGSGLDTATISGGRIVGEFFAGDFVTMTGGRIGNVDLEQANNEMRMSGGTIDTSIEAVQGNDLVEISGTASVGTFIDLGNGNNTFRWLGGSIGGNITMGNGTDTALLSGLSESDFAAGQTIDGGVGAGNDALTFENTTATSVARYLNWETINLTAGSAFTLDGDLQLGDATSGTGELVIDGSSTLFAGGGVNATVLAVTGGLDATVRNAGIIDLTNGAAGATDTFTVSGNYVGNGGIIRLDTVLEGDGSDSDRLVIQGGSATGSTGLEIVNFGGGGAQTTADGILVVEAVDATTDPGAFSLASPVAFGAYEYLLFRGGVSDGSDENWYLRSTLIDPEDPTAPGIPLLRPETAVYSALPPVARDMALATLGTFHERRGEQAFMLGGENFSAAWSRVFGKSLDQDWSGTVSPSMDGAMAGIQVGLDMLRWENASGASTVAGLMAGYAGLDGDVSGNVLGQQGIEVGNLDLDGYSVGGYFTHVGASGWYVDAVALGTWFGGDASTDRGIGIDPDGRALTLSLEGGVPLALSQGWTLEPQAQIIWQDISFDDQDDTLSSVRFDTDDGLTGRIGARLQGTFVAASGEFKPYLKANLWRTFETNDTISFDADPIEIESEGTTLELGGGIAHKFSDRYSAFVAADYNFDISGERRREFEGNIGLQIQW